MARELSYNTATPANVSYHDGKVVRARTVSKDGSSGANRHSIFYNGATDRITFSRIAEPAARTTCTSPPETSPRGRPSSTSPGRSTSAQPRGVHDRTHDATSPFHDGTV